MKKSFFKLPRIISVILCSSIILSAGAIIIKYEYDGAGNRILRSNENLVISPFKSRKIKPDSISDIFQEKNIKVYPNPTNGPINIDILNTNEKDIITANIYTINGEHLLNTSIESSHEILDLTKHNNGWYIINITINDKSKSWKILKTN